MFHNVRTIGYVRMYYRVRALWNMYYHLRIKRYVYGNMPWKINTLSYVYGNMPKRMFLIYRVYQIYSVYLRDMYMETCVSIYILCISLLIYSAYLCVYAVILSGYSTIRTYPAVYMYSVVCIYLLQSISVYMTRCLLLDEICGGYD